MNWLVRSNRTHCQLVFIYNWLILECPTPRMRSSRDQGFTGLLLSAQHNSVVAGRATKARKLAFKCPVSNVSSAMPTGGLTSFWVLNTQRDGWHGHGGTLTSFQVPYPWEWGLTCLGCIVLDVIEMVVVLRLFMTMSLLHRNLSSS